MQSLRTFGGLHCSRTTHKPCFSGQLSGRPSKLNNGSKRIIKTTAFEELRGLGLAAVVDCVRQAGQQLAGMSPPKRVPGRCCVWQQACESAKRLELERIKATIVNALANKQPTQVVARPLSGCDANTLITTEGTGLGKFKATLLLTATSSASDLVKETANSVDNEDLQQAAVQHLQAIFNMPAADSSTDVPHGPPSKGSSSSSHFLAPVWMSDADMQHVVANQPRSSAAYGSTQLCSGAGAATWHPQLTLPCSWAAPSAASSIHPTINPYDIGSISNLNHSTAMTGVNISSSNSKSYEVDVVDSSGSTQMCLQLDPLCSQGVLFEDSQDFSGPGAAAAVAAERDEAHASLRAMQYAHWQQCQEYQCRLAQLNKRVQQLEAQQHHFVASPASRSNTTAASSSSSSSRRAVSTPSNSCSSSGSSSSNKVSSQRCTVQFSIACPTEFGQRLWLVGDAAALGSWDVGSALRLKWAEGGKWVGSADLDVGATRAIKYKAVLQCGPGQFKWAAGDNLELALIAGSHSVEFEFA